MLERDIRKIVENVLDSYLCPAQEGALQDTTPQGANTPLADTPIADIPLEVSARHIHLTTQAIDILFGKGATLGVIRNLSQPGEYLSDKRVKLVTAKGEIANVAVLGPPRSSVQAELSATDCRLLGIQAPVNLSGDLSGAADAIIVGEKGVIDAKGCVIIAKAHLHFTPSDAAKQGVSDRQRVSIKIFTERPITLDGVIVRVSPNFSAALHIDFDEANACMATPQTRFAIIK